MFSTALAAVMAQAFGIAYELLYHNLVSPFLTFARSFEFAVIFAFACLFLMISVFAFMRQAKKPPSSYYIQIIDLFGEKNAIDGLRQTFATYDVAESYARLYRQEYGHQYRFIVTGGGNGSGKKKKKDARQQPQQR